MEIYRVAFIGHRYIENNIRAIEEQLDIIISKLLSEKEFVEFYIGRNGDFDTIAASAIKRAQRNAVIPNSSLILVLSHSLVDTADLERFYDELCYPNIPLKTHYKALITKRNEWMVDQSDLLISYVSDKTGGAAHCMKYALNRGVEVINISDILTH